jgi:hypothetical protein
MNEMTSAQTQLTSRGSIVCRVTKLRAERYGVLIQAGAGNVFILQNTQTDYEPPPPPASYSMGTGVFPRRVKRPGHDFNNSHLPSAEVKNEWIYTSALL